MGRNLYYIALILLVFPFACQKGESDCFSGTGENTVEYRELPPFSQIEFGGLLELNLVQNLSDTFSIQLEGPSDILDGIQATVESGVLKLKNVNRCKWLKQSGQSLKINLNIHHLDKILVEGSASLSSSDSLQLDNFVLEQQSTGSIDLLLNSGQLEVNSFQAGPITLKGYAAVLVTTLYDTGPLYSANLQSDYCFVYNYGLNDAHVNPFKVLESHIQNSGNVYYYADPIESLSAEGRGKGQCVRR
ncbi:MAG: hypothetical protein EP332_02670 [Bacteroidetes bacterium]|nr:MAG: hypothetical protein EP332_02670 [Bacteroidota bacterium]